MTCLGRTFSLTGRRVGVVAASLLAWSCGAGGSVTGLDPVPDPFAAAVVDEPGDVTTSAAKVAVCHLQGSVGKQLTITTTSLRAHMAHGDKVV